MTSVKTIGVSSHLTKFLSGPQWETKGKSGKYLPLWLSLKRLQRI